MTQEQFDKAPLLDQILYDETGMLVDKHPSIAKAMEKYHQAKLKLLGIGGVIECLEQVNATLERHGKVDANTDLHNKIRNTL